MPGSSEYIFVSVKSGVSRHNLLFGEALLNHETLLQVSEEPWLCSATERLNVFRQVIEKFCASVTFSISPTIPDTSYYICIYLSN